LEQDLDKTSLEHVGSTLIRSESVIMTKYEKIFKILKKKSTPEERKDRN
jgi:hypothetical protein